MAASGRTFFARTFRVLSGAFARAILSVGNHGKLTILWTRRFRLRFCRLRDKGSLHDIISRVFDQDPHKIASLFRTQTISPLNFRNFIDRKEETESNMRRSRTRTVPPSG